MVLPTSGGHRPAHPLTMGPSERAADGACCGSARSTAGPPRQRPHQRDGTVMTVIRVLLADDNPCVRESLAAVLVASGRIDVVAQCVDGTEVVAAVARTHPDVVLLDLAMPIV